VRGKYKSEKKFAGGGVFGQIRVGVERNGQSFVDLSRIEFENAVLGVVRARTLFQMGGGFSKTENFTLGDPAAAQGN